MWRCLEERVGWDRSITGFRIYDPAGKGAVDNAGMTIQESTYKINAKARENMSMFNHYHTIY